ncbi:MULTISPECIES: hypothetical protein [Actinoplanes]|uniref:hypothetical protein n=1 Tax=Actinoplanes TaxID=1865 RepID=UPI0005F2D78E|nr:MULTISPECIES: hypothetical protein [Actinoplanes]GLY00697.1 hypothetical protein Acsp01_10760 [Actinoplanes sp. NBRC 101535]
MINNNPGGRLWVDPDGVEGLGLAYEGHVDLYESYLAQVLALRSRYANAWGDDDMGQQFSTKFLEGLDNLEAIIGGVKGTLAYTAEGLTVSARAYREADEAAAEGTSQLERNFESLGTTQGTTTTPEETPKTVLRGGRVTSYANEAIPLQPMMRARLPLAETDEDGEVPLQPAMLAQRTRAVTAEDGTVPLEPMLAAQRPLEPRIDPETGQPLLMRARTVQGKTLLPEGEEEMHPLEPTQSFLTSRRPAEPGLEPEFTPQIPAEERVAMQPLLPAQSNSYSASTPMMPAISSMYMQPSYSTAYVGGEPLPQGYQLISLNPFEDGSTRVDANLYDTITPLSGTAVTNPDGSTIDPGKGQFFVVKENPNVDPTATGYEPFVLSYAPDGTPTPIYAGS